MIEFRRIKLSQYKHYEVYLNEKVQEGYHLKRFTLFFQQFERSDDKTLRYELIPMPSRNSKGWGNNEYAFREFMKTFGRTIVGWIEPIAILKTHEPAFKEVSNIQELELEPIKKRLKRNAFLYLMLIGMWLFTMYTSTQSKQMTITSQGSLATFLLYPYLILTYSIYTYSYFKEYQNLKHGRYSDFKTSKKYTNLLNLITSLIILFLIIGWGGMFGKIISIKGVLWVVIISLVVVGVVKIIKHTKIHKYLKYLAVAISVYLIFVVSFNVLILSTLTSLGSPRETNPEHSENIGSWFEESVIASEYRVYDISEKPSPDSRSYRAVVLHLKTPWMRPIFDYQANRYAEYFNYNLKKVDDTHYLLESGENPTPEIQTLIHKKLSH